MYTVILSVIVYVSALIQKKSFSKLGETVTYKVRTLLYADILTKNIGWFDLKDNSTGVLTATMSEKTA